VYKGTGQGILLGFDTGNNRKSLRWGHLRLTLFHNKMKDDVWFMSEQKSKDPLHGVTLEQIVSSLVEYYGWPVLGSRIDIRCFNLDPSVKSSLKFLRKTPWARKKVEKLYLVMKKEEGR